MTIFSGIVSGAAAETNNVLKREYDPRKVTNINMTAFDCGSNRGNYSAVELVDLSPCPDLTTDYLPAETARVSLVQTNVPIHLTVYRCRIKLSKKIISHGMSSYGYRFRDEFDDRMIWLPASYCMQMHHKKSRQFICSTGICLGKPSSLIKIPDNDKEVFHSWQTRGSYDRKDNAYPVTFETERGELVHAVETANIKIMLSNFTATLNARTRVVEIPQLHARVNFDSGFYHHETAGLLAWERPDLNCSMFSAIITKNATATVRKLKAEKRPVGVNNEFVGAIVIVEDEKVNRATGVVLAENKDPCTANCHETNVDSLNVCLGEEELESLDPLEMRPATRLTRLNMQAQGVYIELNSKLEREELHAELLTEICRIETKLIHQDIASILNTANPYALKGTSIANSEDSIKYVHEVLLMGSVAYFSQCIPESVTVVEIANCTQQIPVIRADGALWFVDSISHKLVEFPSVLQCISGLPVQYKINGRFFCHDPIHRACPQGTEPSKLQPAAGKRAKGIQIEDLKVLGGLTTTKQQDQMIREHKKLVEMNYVVVKQMAMNAAKNTVEESSRLGGIINIAMPLTEFDVSRLTDAVAGRMFFMFKLLGQIYLHILGITMFLTVIKHLCECAYRIYHLYKHFGWGMWMWKAFFNTIFSVATLPKMVLVSTTKEAMNNLKEYRDKIAPEPEFKKYEEVLKVHSDGIAHLRQVILDLSTHPDQFSKEDRERIVANLYPIDQLKDATDKLLSDRPNQPLLDAGHSVPDAPSLTNTCEDDTRFDNPRFRTRPRYEDQEEHDLELGKTDPDNEKESFLGKPKE